MLRLGIFLLIIGVMSFILPAMGYQLRIISIFGSNAPIAGGVAIGLGALFAFLGAIRKR